MTPFFMNDKIKEINKLLDIINDESNMNKKLCALKKLNIFFDNNDSFFDEYFNKNEFQDIINKI